MFPPFPLDKGKTIWLQILAAAVVLAQEAADCTQFDQTNRPQNPMAMGSESSSVALSQFWSILKAACKSLDSSIQHYNCV